jgi:hypothetical protein
LLAGTAQYVFVSTIGIQYQFVEQLYQDLQSLFVEQDSLIIGQPQFVATQ